MKKTYLILVIALVIIFGIGAVYLFQKNRVEINPIFGVLDRPNIEAVRDLREIKLTIDFKNKEEVDKTASVYKITRDLNVSRAIDLAKKLGFKTKPKGTKALTVSEGKKELVVDLSSNLMFYKDNNIRPKKIVGKEILINKASKMLDNLGLAKPSLKPAKSQLYNAPRGEFIAVEREAEATFLEVNFDRAIDSYSVGLENPVEAYATVVVTGAGELFSISYRDFVEVEKEALYPLIAAGDISIYNLVTYGRLVFPRGGETLVGVDLINEIIVEDYSLILLDDHQSNYLMPTYLLRGIGKSGTETAEVVIYLPAVGLEWLK